MRKIKILYIFTKCQKVGPIRQMLNLISNIDRNFFSPELITISDEDITENSLLNSYKEILPCSYIPVSKINILLGFYPRIRKIISEKKPDIIHTLGVFPNYMVSKIGFKNHVITARNYVYDDYLDKYGKLLGIILAKMQLFAIQNSNYSLCCSKSLHDIYLEKLKLNLPFIRNGVNTSMFIVPDTKQKNSLREMLNLPKNKRIFVYSGYFIERKNQEFILNCISNSDNFLDCLFLFLGEGPNYSVLKEKFKKFPNFSMRGEVTNIVDYLQASDYYISSSKSEGLPNGVLEGMSTGLPIFVSDIPQHLEILNTDSRVGMGYKSNDPIDFITKLKIFVQRDYTSMSNASVQCVNKYFSASIMSKNYQNFYNSIIKNE